MGGGEGGTEEGEVRWAGVLPWEGSTACRAWRVEEVMGGGLESTGREEKKNAVVGPRTTRGTPGGVGGEVKRSAGYAWRGTGWGREEKSVEEDTERREEKSTGCGGEKSALHGVKSPEEGEHWMHGGEEKKSACWWVDHSLHSGDVQGVKWGRWLKRRGERRVLERRSAGGGEKRGA